MISPLRLYLYLKPLYSNRGGSTTRAEAFTKNDVFVNFLLNPLYKWKILHHRMFVLSEIKTHDSFNKIYIFKSIAI